MHESCHNKTHVWICSRPTATSFMAVGVHKKGGTNGWLQWISYCEMYPGCANCASENLRRVRARLLEVHAGVDSIYGVEDFHTVEWIPLTNSWSPT